VAVGYRIAEGYLEVTADTDKADRKLDQFFRHADGKLRDRRGRYASEGNLAGMAYGKKLAEGADKESDRGFNDMFRKLARGFGSGGKMLGSVFANKFMAMAVGGLGALPSAISAVTAAVGGAIHIGGSLAALAPAGIGALVLTIGTLKTAFSGLGAALKAGLTGDMEAFAKATKDMAPAMQEAVKGLVALNPLIKDLKRNVQQNFWSQFVNDIRPVATTYLPMISAVMGTIAKGFGGAADSVLKFLQGSSTIAGMSQAFRDIGDSVTNITGGLGPLVQAFLTLFQVGAGFLPGLTAGFDQLATKFAAFTSNAAADGSLQRWISGGLSLIGDLGVALGNLVGIFRSIGQAVPSGGGIFAGLAGLLDMVNKFFKTLQGQAVLNSFFAKLQALGTIVINLVSAALPGLLTLSDALITGLGFLAPIATTVGQALGAVATAIAPILPTLGKLLGVVLTLAGGVLQALAGELGPLIGLWAQLASGLADRLMPVLTEMISQGLPLAIELGKALADAFAPLVPVILQIAGAVGDELMKELPQFLDISRQMLPVITDVAKQIGGALLDAFTRLAPYIPGLVEVFLILLRVFMTFITFIDGTVFRVFGFLIYLMIEVGSAVLAFLLQVYKLPGIIASAAAAVWGFVTGAASAFYGWIVNVVNWLQQLPGKILSALVAFPGILLNFLVGTLSKAAYAVGFFVGAIIRFFIDAPGKIWQALQALPGLLASVFTAAWNWVKNITSSAASAVVGFALSLPGRVRSAVSSLISMLGGVAISAWNGARNGFINGVNAVVALARSLPGRIKSALSGAGGWLIGVGEDIVRGLGRGIENMLGWVRDKAKEIANSAIDGAKRALGIGSPSKVFRDEVGAWIPPGMQAGVEKAMPAFQQYMTGAMQSLAQAPNVSVAAPQVAVGGAQITVLLDGEEIRARVVTPKAVAAANVEGQRRRDWRNTGRKSGAPATATS
jgi:phage-related protein